MLSTKPYLVRALWSWCCDSGFTPYLTVWVDAQCRVPQDYVREGSITLNLSPEATGQLEIGNDWISLSARFGGVSQEIFVPMGSVIGICARENGVGLEFPYDAQVEVVEVDTDADRSADLSLKPAQKSAEKPVRPAHLQRIK